MNIRPPGRRALCKVRKASSGRSRCSSTSLMTAASNRPGSGLKAAHRYEERQTRRAASKSPSRIDELVIPDALLKLADVRVYVVDGKPVLFMLAHSEPSH